MLCPKCLSENGDTSKFCNNCGLSFGAEDKPGFTATKTLETPIQAISKGTLIAGKYRILEEIGRGGMGIVYKAEDTKLKRTVALKFLPHQWTSDAAARERFIHEAQAASALDHPHICNIHEIEETDDGRMYIAMAFYEGESLRDRIKREPLKAEEAIDIASQIGQGMANAHRAGIVHRDIKPANILITKDGSVKIVDFGLAKLAGQVKLTREGTTIGTVAYMSPEQARGDAVDQRTDIWSLGVVLYEMLAGNLPFKGDFEQTLIYSILKSEPEPLTKFRKDLPAGLENIIAKALTKNLSARYQTMDELVEDLKAVAEGLKPLRAKAGLLRGKVLGIKKVHAIAGLGVSIILAALALLFLFPKRGQAYDWIAVLPLINSSSDPEKEIFCEGMHASLTTELSRIKSLNVINRGAVMTFKGSTKKATEKAKELRVKALVEGTIFFSGDRVRTNIELIDGQTGRNIWAGDFEEEDRNALTMQKQTALAIANRINATLDPDVTKTLRRKPQVNRDALQAYLKGMEILNVASQASQDAKECVRYFEQALKIDPNFALAYAGLALAYDYLGGNFKALTKDVWPKAKEAARKALSLDDSLPDAQYVLARLAYFPDYDWNTAETELRRFIGKYPSHSLGHIQLASILILRGKEEEVIHHAKLARMFDPMTYSTGELVAIVYSGIPRWNEYMELLKELIISFPDNPHPHWLLAIGYWMKGRFADAFPEMQRAYELGLKPHPMYMVHYYVLSGEKVKGEELLNDFLSQSSKEEIDNMSYAIGRIYTLLGKKDKAFEWLDLAYELRNDVLPWMKTDELMDNIRSDPRFMALLKKMNLEK